jgi:uncharacterized protein (TIGR03086 family)
VPPPLDARVMPAAESCAAAGASVSSVTAWAGSLLAGVEASRNRYGEAMTDERLDVLTRGLEQAATLLGEVPDERLDDPTPCSDWTVADLVDHLVAAPGRFARMVRDEDIDWSAPTPHVGRERVEAFRAAADDLLAAWQGQDDAGQADWQSAELAVHTYDLATALGRSTSDLDPAVAEHGLAFMQAHLTADNRAPAFDQERPAPDGADVYQRVAAYAGRDV